MAIIICPSNKFMSLHGLCRDISIYKWDQIAQMAIATIANSLMDAQLESELYQQAFQLFVEGFSNRDILGISKKFTPRGIAKILQTEIDLVLDELETAVAAIHSFTKDKFYEKRRNLVIRELSEDRRLVFSGVDANTLGEANVHNFLKICSHYFKQSNFTNYPFENLYNIFLKWLLPGKERPHRDGDRENGYIELQKKKRQMQALRIEHEILLKKSKMLELEAEIQSLKENLSRKSDSKLKMEEDLFESKQEPVRPERKRLAAPKKVLITHMTTQQPPSVLSQQLKPILKMPKLVQSSSQLKNPETKKESPKNGQAKKSAIDKALLNHKKESESQRSKEQPRGRGRASQSQVQGEAREREGGLRWKKEENEYFVKLLGVYSIRDQTNLQNQMVKKFGRKDRFTVHNIRDKKFEMFRECRRRFLLVVKNRKLMNDSQYGQFVEHFETMDNRCAYDFQSKFLSQYYLCRMEDLTDRTMREIAEAVLKQKTRILTAKYMKKKKMDKQKLDSKEALVRDKALIATKAIRNKPELKIEEGQQAREEGQQAREPSTGHKQSEKEMEVEMEVEVEVEKDSLDPNVNVGQESLDCKEGFRQKQQES